MTNTDTNWGYIVRFDTPEEMLEAAARIREAGYSLTDSYSPIPVEGITEALGIKKTKIQWLIGLAGLTGAAGGFFMQYYANVHSYPWNVGGRPLNSWPSWMPVTFELTVLCAAFMAVFGMIAINGLPKPYHPVFNVREFNDGASEDKFFISIEAKDPKFDAAGTKTFLESLGGTGVFEVQE